MHIRIYVSTVYYVSKELRTFHPIFCSSSMDVQQPSSVKRCGAVFSAAYEGRKYIMRYMILSCQVDRVICFSPPLFFGCPN